MAGRVSRIQVSALPESCRRLLDQFTSCFEIGIWQFTINHARPGMLWLTVSSGGARAQSLERLQRNFPETYVEVTGASNGYLLVKLWDCSKQALYARNWADMKPNPRYHLTGTVRLGAYKIVVPDEEKPSASQG